MGSKKQLSQARRAWESRISRPLQAYQLVERTVASIEIEHKFDKKTQRDLASHTAQVAIQEWKDRHRTIYSVDTDLRNELLRSDLPAEPIPTSVLRYIPHESPMFVLDDPIVLSHDGIDNVQYGQFIVIPTDFNHYDEDDASLGFYMREVGFQEANCLRIVWLGTLSMSKGDDYFVVTQTIDLEDEEIDMRDTLVEIAKQDAETREQLEYWVAERGEDWGNITSALFPTAAMLLLYAASEQADISDEIRPDPVLSQRGSYRGSILSVRDLGIRIGSALRVTRSSTQSSDHPTGRTVTPHLRKAHWHRFWTGPRNGERKMVIRWLPPIPVNLDKGDIIPTVHKV